MVPPVDELETNNLSTLICVGTTKDATRLYAKAVEAAVEEAGVLLVRPKMVRQQAQADPT